MEFKDLASVSGKSGLFKVLTPTRTGVILESLDEQKKKMVRCDKAAPGPAVHDHVPVAVEGAHRSRMRQAIPRR